MYVLGGAVVSKRDKMHPRIVEIPLRLNMLIDSIEEKHGIDVRAEIITVVLDLLGKKDELIAKLTADLKESEYGQD